MWLCRLIANMVEYLATHKLLVFVSFLSVFNLLCYSIPEGYLLKGNAEFYWIIALAVLVSIMIGKKKLLIYPILNQKSYIRKLLNQNSRIGLRKSGLR